MVFRRLIVDFIELLLRLYCKWLNNFINLVQCLRDHNLSWGINFIKRHLNSHIIEIISSFSF
jgi:hypothetical protein